MPRISVAFVEGAHADDAVADAGTDPADIHLDTADGLRLRARWWPAQGTAAASVVLVHGFSASQRDGGVRALAGELARVGYDVLTYDARGHGESQGSSGVGSTEHLDVACAVEAALSQQAPVALVGVSMGGVAVSGYLSGGSAGRTADIAGAVLVSTPSRWRMRVSPVGVLTTLLTRTRPGRLVASRLMRVRISPDWHVGEPLESLVERIELPLAVVHGTGDRLLAQDHGRRLHACAAGPSRLQLVEGMGHGIDVVPSRAAVVGAVAWVLNAARETRDAQEVREAARRVAPEAPTTTPGR